MTTVFITGASSGLGRALAQQYAASGATLGLLGRREAALQELAASLPGAHRCYAVDVRDRQALHAAAQDFIAFCQGRVDVVIASAGISAGTLTEHGDADIVSPAVRRTMYRVVQESLTNVHKHAPGAHTEITIHCGPSTVRAVIRNTAPSSTPDAAPPRSGSGLLGLRGREEMVGGTLTAGPTDDGGFQVDAVLPAFVPT